MIENTEINKANYVKSLKIKFLEKKKKVKQSGIKSKDISDIFDVIAAYIYLISITDESMEIIISASNGLAELLPRRIDNLIEESSKAFSGSKDKVDTDFNSNLLELLRIRSFIIELFKSDYLGLNGCIQCIRSECAFFELAHGSVSQDNLNEIVNKYNDCAEDICNLERLIGSIKDFDNILGRENSSGTVIGVDDIWECIINKIYEKEPYRDQELLLKDEFSIIYQAAWEYYKSCYKEKTKSLNESCNSQFFRFSRWTEEFGWTGESNHGLYDYLMSLGFSCEFLIKSGLVNDINGEFHDNFINRIIIPLYSEDGKCIGFQGRTIISDGVPKYINTKETPLFSKGKFVYGLDVINKYFKSTESKLDYIIMCEGTTDVLSLRQNGYPNAVAILGTALTREQANIIAKYDKTLYLCFDSDGAGKIAMHRAISMLCNKGVHLKLMTCGPYKDADELLINLGAKEFHRRIDNAFDLDEITDKFDEVIRSTPFESFSRNCQNDKVKVKKHGWAYSIE